MLKFDREVFVDTVEFMLKDRKKWEKINEIYEDSFFYPAFEYEDRLVGLLKILLDDTDEDCGWMEYFLYDCNGDVSQAKVWDASGKEVSLTSWDDVYDFLVYAAKDAQKREQSAVEEADNL